MPTFVLEQAPEPIYARFNTMAGRPGKNHLTDTPAILLPGPGVTLCGVWATLIASDNGDDPCRRCQQNLTGKARAHRVTHEPNHAFLP